MKNPRANLSSSRRKGMALIVVVSVLTLCTLLVLALFSTSQTELKSTAAFTKGAAARLYADTAVNIVIGQIQAASQQDEDEKGTETWVSQPGMVRQYRENGTLLRGNKLYSDSSMIATTETQIANDVPPNDWDQQPDVYVDMNEPVVRLDSNNPAAPPQLYFPIIDPRAYSLDPDKSVEGFSYSATAKGQVSGPALNGVVLPTEEGDEDVQRTPMPVEWLYVLKDGTLGYLDNQKIFTGPNGIRATVINPIVSRIAFWTDDESCKLNINTAGEGTQWDTPRLFHERDRDWAQYQPMGYEYQRYPGHPATVAMSTVLYPNKEMNPPVREAALFNKALAYKETIYDLMPKILPGGSKAGSVIVPSGRTNFKPTDFDEVKKALGERLFASVDEFLLRPQTDGAGLRQEFNFDDSDMWKGLNRSSMVERLRFFLTPRSSAPETNPFGLPKIAMWPVHANNNADYRTVYDQTIAYCSTLAKKTYFFTREDSRSQTELSGVQRNLQLYNYLLTLSKKPIPGFGTTTKATFEEKYGANLQQILVEMFDYIRSTNLYDENLATKAVGENPAIPGLPDARHTAYQASGGLKSRTFTPMRNSTGSSYPGSGQVTPTVMPKSSTEVYRGMGRFFTISEIGMHFICCAEGTSTAGGATAEKLNPTQFPPAVSSSTPSWKGGKWGNSKFWYSNFPPLSSFTPGEPNNFYKIKYPTTHTLEDIDGDDPNNYPGYNVTNWNWCLDKDEPLPEGTKRVQATILLEWFCPSTGWGLINPDLKLEIDASEISVAGQRIFPNSKKVVLKPYGHMSDAWGIYKRGGTTSYRAFLQGRKLPRIKAGQNGYTKGSLEEDNGYLSSANRPGVAKDSIQYNLVSDFFDIPNGGAIKFDGGKVVVKIFPNSTASNLKALQTFNFDFPAAPTMPAPLLAQRSEDTTWGLNSDGKTYTKKLPVAAPYWWAFNADGALGRLQNGQRDPTLFNNAQSWGGRFMYIGSEIGSYGNTPGTGHYYRGNLATPSDTIQSLVLRHGDPRLTMGQYIVPDTEFEPHRFYGQRNLAHNIVFAHWGDGPGLDKGDDKKGWRLVRNANYNLATVPDHPYTQGTADGLQRYGDFDRGVATQSDGAYINKPDEGNAYVITNATTQERTVPYFSDSWVVHLGGSTYFSPNRQISSPGMFGSLPTGVHDAGTTAAKRRQPWRTLLFRPQTFPWAGSIDSHTYKMAKHIGAPKTLKGFGGASGYPMGGIDPPDYLFMDFFWMPVVEPYAISTPGATAGKINLNYQMVPFRHIKRATGLHAVMKSEVMTAVSTDDANVYLSRPPKAPVNGAHAWFWKEDDSAEGKKYWHRQIDADATLKIFDERFSSGFAFISPAQICDMYLLPKKAGSHDLLVPDKWPVKMADLLKTSGTLGTMVRFWSDHAITGENLRERPYTNMYPRLTTRSNTFQVFMRAQTITKARSSDPAKFVDGVDDVNSEYRGSAIVERYLNLNAPALTTTTGLDFASTNPTTKSLDQYHRFRVLSQKRFNP